VSILDNGEKSIDVRIAEISHEIYENRFMCFVNFVVAEKDEPHSS
jgi:hypothetical protein